MRILVVFGSKAGGTAGIAETLGRSFEGHGHHAEVRPADAAPGIADFDAVVVGGALYANRWHKAARRFVRRNATALRGIPTWFFSSGPLGESAEGFVDIAPTRMVQGLMDLVGARGHVTFGGRLIEQPEGFMARSMAKTMSGDWRNAEQMDTWVTDILLELAEAPATT